MAGLAKDTRAFSCVAGAALLCFALSGVVFSRSVLEAVFLFIALALLFWAAVYDHARGVIPFIVCILLAVLSLAAALFAVPPTAPSRIFGFLLGLILPLLARGLFLRRGSEALGLGDVHFLASLGLLLGGKGVLLTIVLGSFLTILAAAVCKVRRLPFAPALSLAAAAALFL